MYDIDQVPKSLSPGSGSSDMTATTDSPTNDGYDVHVLHVIMKPIASHVEYVST